MATFKVIVQKQRNDGFWPVYIRITHNRGVKYIRTDKIVDSKGVDKKNREVKDPFVLQSCSARIAKFAELLNKVEIRKCCASLKAAENFLFLFLLYYFFLIFTLPALS